MLEFYLQMLELGYYEVPFAFEGLRDKNVWKRPSPGLLSVGELAGHIAYWEAGKLAGAGGEKGHPDLTMCRVSSLLIDPRFGYFPTTLTTPPSEQHLAMTAKQVGDELLRVHQETTESLKALNPDLSSGVPGYSLNHTYEEVLKYAVFHVSYHTGQMYSARHLLGEETPDN